MPKSESPKRTKHNTTVPNATPVTQYEALIKPSTAVWHPYQSTLVCPVHPQGGDLGAVLADASRSKLRRQFLNKQRTQEALSS